MSIHQLDMDELNRRIDAKRAETDLTAAGLAKLLGLSRSTMTRIKSGARSRPDADTLVTLLVWLGAEIGDVTQPTPEQP